MLVIAILVTWAIKRAVEDGKAEYGHIRDRRAAELARTYPDWSSGRVQRVARRAARGYWWRQIRRGWPEVRAAYTESRGLAEAARIEGETAGLQRSAEIRERIRKALADAEEIREKERRREAGVGEVEAPEAKPEPAAETTDARPPQAAAGEPRTSEPRPRAPEMEQGGEDEAAPPSAQDEPLDPATEPTPPPPRPPQLCSNCWSNPPIQRDSGDDLCDDCWTNTTSNAEPIADPAPADQPGARIFPFKQPQATAAANPTEGDTMTVPTGEYTGYEAAVANWTAIEQLSQQLNSHYEQLMAAYRSMNVDDQTIGRAGACHEAEENHLVAVQSARSDFVSRHGAVKETKEATATSGDQALYNS